MGPLLYLTLSSVRNRMRIRLKRLREPRYLIGTMVGLSYLWLVFWRPRPRPAMPITATGSAYPALELAGAAVLFMLAALSWLQPRNRPALAFSRADVQFLFPAPFTRRELIRYRVIRSQVGILIGSAFMTLFFRPASLASGWTSFIGIALAMMAVNLHLMGVSLSRESMSAHGMAGLTRQWLPLALVVGAVAILAVTVVSNWQTLAPMSGGDMITELQRLGTTGAAGVVLWPFRAISRLPFTGTPSAFLQALPAALFILILNYIWVVRSDAKFEEASAELAEKIAGFRKGPRPKARNIRVMPTPFVLSLNGPPEMAIFWKNLILLGRYVSLRTLLRFGPMFFILVLALPKGGRAGSAGAALGAICIVIYGLTILLGPFMARNDLRQDLTNLALMKTWPIRGAALVRGEVMAPAALLTVITWLCSLGGLLFAASIRLNPSFVAAAALIAPGIILLQLLVQNAIAVTWPSWVVTGTPRVRGIDVMGQRMILMLGLIVVLLVAVLPAAIIAGGSGVAIYYLTGTVTVILPSMIATIVLFGEAFLASEMIGKLLDRTDVSAVDASDE